jgi:hypothetical protein
MVRVCLVVLWTKLILIELILIKSDFDSYSTIKKGFFYGLFHIARNKNISQQKTPLTTVFFFLEFSATPKSEKTSQQQ